MDEVPGGGLTVWQAPSRLCAGLLWEFRQRRGVGARVPGVVERGRSAVGTGMYASVTAAAVKSGGTGPQRAAGVSGRKGAPPHPAEGPLSRRCSS